MWSNYSIVLFHCTLHDSLMAYVVCVCVCMGEEFEVDIFLVGEGSERNPKRKRFKKRQKPINCKTDGKTTHHRPNHDASVMMY